MTFRDYHVWSLEQDRLERERSKAMTHTPGPWYAGCFTDENSTCDCRSILSEGYMGSICQVSLDNGKLMTDGGNDAPPRKEAIANARLIAAAPDLLEACEEFVRKVECGEARSKRSYKQMAAAIAKAKGTPETET